MLKICKPMLIDLGSVRHMCTVKNVAINEEQFKPLNLRYVKGQRTVRRPFRRSIVMEPRSKKMAVDQDWGNVWPGPRSFHPATVPIPIHQGAREKGAPPDKFANAELMKIPNFLHLTPPVIRRQCEALKRFCTMWPSQLNTDEKCAHLLPLEVVSSTYCRAGPSIRHPLARIVSVRFKLAALGLDSRATDKFCRLVGERYDTNTDMVVIVADRCPTRQQNTDYLMYLITALYHESLNVEPWEQLKSEADMERYVWQTSKSQEHVEQLKAMGVITVDSSAIDSFRDAVERLMNDGESEQTIRNYGHAVRMLLNLPGAEDQMTVQPQ